MAKQLIKKMVRRESTKPRLKTGIANAPMAKDETTMLADIHYESSYQHLELLFPCKSRNSPACRLSSGFCPSSHPQALSRYLSARRRIWRLLVGCWHMGCRPSQRLPLTPPGRRWCKLGDHLFPDLRRLASGSRPRSHSWCSSFSQVGEVPLGTSGSREEFPQRWGGIRCVMFCREMEVFISVKKETKRDSPSNVEREREREREREGGRGR